MRHIKKKKFPKLSDKNLKLRIILPVKYSDIDVVDFTTLWRGGGGGGQLRKLPVSHCLVCVVNNFFIAQYVNTIWCKLDLSNF